MFTLSAYKCHILTSIIKFKMTIFMIGILNQMRQIQLRSDD